jgi:hypothetical protein
MTRLLTATRVVHAPGGLCAELPLEPILKLPLHKLPITCLLQVRFLNRMLDLCHWYLLSARVMLTQHSAALHALGTQGSSSSSRGGSTGHSRGEPVVAGAATAEPQAEVLHYHEPGHKSTDPTQAYTPPHQQLVEARPMSLIQRQTPVLQVLQNVVEDCRCAGLGCACRPTAAAAAAAATAAVG